MTPAERKQHKLREGKILAELCAAHGYSFADSLGKDGTTMVMSKDAKGKTKIAMAYVIKLLVPTTSALGVQIGKGRTERNPATNKSARARARDHARNAQTTKPPTKQPAAPTPPKGTSRR